MVYHVMNEKMLIVFVWCSRTWGEGGRNVIRSFSTAKGAYKLNYK